MLCNELRALQAFLATLDKPQQTKPPAVTLRQGQRACSAAAWSVGGPVSQVRIRQQALGLTGRDQRTPGPRTEPLARQLTEEKAGDRRILASVTDDPHADHYYAGHDRGTDPIRRAGRPLTACFAVTVFIQTTIRNGYLERPVIGATGRLATAWPAA